MADTTERRRPWRHRAALQRQDDHWLHADYLPHGFEPTEEEKKALKQCTACGRWTERYYYNDWGATCRPCDWAA